MNDPRRLLEGDASAVERALLQAADTDEPASGAEQRLLLSLGLLDLQAAPGATATTISKGALGKGVVTLAGKWLLLAGLGAGVWWAARERPAVVSTGRVEHRESETAARASEPSTPTAPDDSLAREVATLDRARAALVRGEQHTALAVLTGYQRDYPSGVLQQEATVLRIQALMAARDQEGARSAAAAFLRSHPQSPHARRLQVLLKLGDPARDH